VNTRDKNYTPGAIRLRIEQVDASVARYLGMLDTADHQEDRVAKLRVTRLSERLDAVMGLRQNPRRGDCPPE